MTAPRIPNRFDKYGSQSKNRFDKYSTEPPNGGSLAIDDYDASIEEEEENPFFLKKAWNFARFFNESLSPASLMTRKSTPTKTFEAFKTGAEKSYDEVKDIIENRGLGNWFNDQAKDAAGAIGQMVTQNPLDTANQFANGLIEFFLENPTESIIGSKNVNGTPVPMTPEEHTTSVQQTIASVGDFLIQRGVTKKILKTPTGVEAAKATKLGNLGKTLLSNAAGGVAGAAATQPLAQLGQEDYLSKIISSTLVTGTVGTVLGSLFDYGSYNRSVMESKVDFKVAQKTLANARAAAAFLQNNPTKTPAEITASIQAILESDDVVEAAVRAGIHGKVFVVPSLSIDEGEALLAKIASSPAGPKEYELPPQFAARIRPTYRGIPISWESQFDLIAYHAQAQGFAKNPDLMADVMAKTGINKEQLIAHGKSVKAKLKEMDSAGMYVGLTQGDIEFLDTGYAARGRDMVTSARDGETLVDFNNKQWVKSGEHLISGNERVPINSITNFLAFGKDPKHINPAGNKKLIVGQQLFQGDFNRNTETVNITYGPRGEAVIHAKPLTIEGEELFRQTGFLPMESVSIRGRVGDFSVVGFREYAKDNRGPKTILREVTRISGNKGEADLVKAFDLRGELDQELATKPIKLRVRSYQNGKWVEENVFANDLIRNSSNKTSSEYAVEGGKITFKAGIADQDKYTNTFIEKVTSNYQRDVLSKLDTGKELPTFQDVYLRTAKELGLREATANELRPLVYDKVGQTLINNTLDPVEASTFQIIRSAIENNVMKEEGDLAGFYNQLLDRNGYYHLDRGPQIEIRDISSGDLVVTVNNLREGIDFVSKSGKMPLPSYDGAIPTEFMKLGNLATSIKLHDTKWSQRIDLLNTSRHGFNFVPIRNLWASVSNNLERLGINSTIFKRVEEVNDALMKRRMFFAQHEGLMKSFSEAVKSADGLDGIQLDHINRIMQTMTRDEIVSSYLSRPMNQIELEFSTQLASDLAAINETTQAISNGYLLGVRAGKLGSVDFRSAVMEGMAKNQINPKITKLLLDFSDRIQLHGPETFSPHAVLKLTNALQYPSTAKSFSDYARTSGINPQAIEVAVKLKKTFEDAGVAANIPEAKRIGAYLPQMREIDAFNAYHDIKLPEGFAREMNRVLSDRDDLVRNPLMLAYSYIQATANEYAGTSKIMKALEKEIYDPEIGVAHKLSNIKSFDNSQIAAGKKQAHYITGLYDKYKEAVMGYPDLSEKAARAVDVMSQHLFKKNSKGFESGSILALVDSAYVGGRPIQSIRDILTSIGVSYQLFGAKFTTRSLMDGISFTAKDLDLLEADLKIPRIVSQDFLAPDTDYASSSAIAAEKGFVRKAQEIGMTLSGQHYVYIRTLAGTYKRTVEVVYDQLGKARRQEISLEDAINNIQIDMHSPQVQREFLAFANSGDIEGAARHLGKWNGKIIANNYGEMQSPITWKKGMGRILGQFGSWGANMMQTQLDATRSFGTPQGKYAYKRALRAGAYMGAVMLAGNEVGIDLKNILFTPVQAAPGLAPVAQIYFDLVEAGNELFSADESIRKRGFDSIMRQTVPGYPKWSDVGKWYIPMGYQMRDIFRATEAWNNGSDPFEVAAKAIGFKIIE